MATESVETLIEGGKATAAPPLGPALGPLGVNIGEVVAEINKKTASFNGMQVPVKVSVDSDTKAFAIEIGTPPTSQLVIKEAQLQKGSGRASSEFVGDLLIEQTIKIAKMKEDDLLGRDLKAKVKQVIGTCRSMGVKIEHVDANEATHLVNLGKYDKKITAEKTEISEQEMQEMRAERESMQADIKKVHEEMETKAAQIVEKFKGKPVKDLRAALREAQIADDIVNRLAPEEKTPEKK